MRPSCVRTLAVALLVSSLAAPAALADDSIRCGQWLVGVGATMGEVRYKCGDHSEAYRDVEYIDTGNGVVAQVIDLWVYNRGPNDFVRTLSFRGGALVHVHVGDRGY